jgi:glycosyltransferase involved in cell wall biosynthesis
MASKIREVVARCDVDIVQIEHSLMSAYVEAIPSDSRCKRVLSFHNVAFNQYGRMAGMEIGYGRRLLYMLKGLIMRRWETKYAERFDRCLVVSAAEGDLLRKISPNLDISIVENGVDTEFYKPLIDAPGNKTLLFIGTMQYPPNIDAVLYFCKNIMPLIRRQIPDVKLIVAGQAPAPEIHRLTDRGNVIVTGYVSDLISLYKQSDITVVPLRAGGGTRLKILESMALGRPVVSTSVGCEGLNVIDGENIMIADSPHKFAGRVVQLLEDKELRTQLCQNASQLVNRLYDWSEISRKLIGVYNELVC